MFCSYCGQKCGHSPSARFCSNCGKEIAAGTSSSIASPVDWSYEVCFETLIKIPEVVQLVGYEAAHATSRMTGEEFLQASEKALAPLLGGVPISKVAAFVQPLYAKWGLGTGKAQTFDVPQPIGKTIVAILCSLARNSQPIRWVDQLDDGCIIEAILPSDMYSFAGELILDIRRDGNSSHVQAAAKVKGQLFDWGKSRRCLETLVNETQPLRKAG